MHAPAQLETARLRLRRPVIGDAATIFAEYAHDAEVTRYLTWRPHPGIETTRLFVERCLGSWARATAFPWVITRAADGRLLGMIEARREGHRVELGYVLARAHWGQGFTTEAARAVVGWALGEPGVFRVWAVCDVDNHASARVLAKAGLQREGVLRRWLVHPNLGAEPRDCLSYSRLKEDLPEIPGTRPRAPA